MAHSCAGAFLRKEGWMQYSSGLVPSSPTVESLLRTPWPAKLTLKFGQNLSLINGKIHSTSFDIWQGIWQSQKFAKVGIYPIFTHGLKLHLITLVKLCLHWWSHHDNACDSDSHYLLALATFGDATQILLFLFLVTLPKVAKASTIMTVVCRHRWWFCFANFANVNDPLGSAIW